MCRGEPSSSSDAFVRDSRWTESARHRSKASPRPLPDSSSSASSRCRLRTYAGVPPMSCESRRAAGSGWVFRSRQRCCGRASSARLTDHSAGPIRPCVSFRARAITSATVVEAGVAIRPVSSACCDASAALGLYGSVSRFGGAPETPCALPRRETGVSCASCRQVSTFSCLCVHRYHRALLASKSSATWCFVLPPGPITLAGRQRSARGGAGGGLASRSKASRLDPAAVLRG